MSGSTDEEGRTDVARRLTYRAPPAEEVFAKLPALVREAGEDRGLALIAEHQRPASAKATIR